MRGLPAILAAVTLAACASSPVPAPPHAAPTSRVFGSPITRPIRLADRATVTAPRRWFSIPFRGVPATVYFPIVFLSSRRMPAGCPTGPHTTSYCQDQNWFPPRWQTPDDGMLVLWAKAEFGPGQTQLPGRPAVVGGWPASVYAGPATSSCPAGTSDELDAYVRAFGRRYAGERLDMKARLGPHASAQDRRAVRTMLAGLRTD